MAFISSKSYPWLQQRWFRCCKLLLIIVYLKIRKIQYFKIILEIDSIKYIILEGKIFNLGFFYFRFSEKKIFNFVQYYLTLWYFLWNRKITFNGKSEKKLKNWTPIFKACNAKNAYEPDLAILFYDFSRN